MFDAGEASAAGSAAKSPPCLVLERGSPTLQEILGRRISSKLDSSNRRSLAEQPFVNRSIFIQLCESLGYLHGKGLVARRISTEGAAFFENAGRWRLTDFASWARRGDEAPLDTPMRYAAPEVRSMSCTCRASPHESACNLDPSLPVFFRLLLHFVGVQQRPACMEV